MPPASWCFPLAPVMQAGTLAFHLFVQQCRGVEDAVLSEVLRTRIIDSISLLDPAMPQAPLRCVASHSKLKNLN